MGGPNSFWYDAKRSFIYPLNRYTAGLLTAMFGVSGSLLRATRTGANDGKVCNFFTCVFLNIYIDVDYDTCIGSAVRNRLVGGHDDGAGQAAHRPSKGTIRMCSRMLFYEFLQAADPYFIIADQHRCTRTVFHE